MSNFYMYQRFLPPLLFMMLIIVSVQCKKIPAEGNYVANFYGASFTGDCNELYIPVKLISADKNQLTFDNGSILTIDKDSIEGEFYIDSTTDNSQPYLNGLLSKEKGMYKITGIYSAASVSSVCGLSIVQGTFVISQQ